MLKNRPRSARSRVRNAARARWMLAGAGVAGALGFLAGAGEIRFGNGPFEINEVVLTEASDGTVNAWRARSRTDFDTGATVTTVEWLGYGSREEGVVVNFTQLQPAADAEPLNGRVVRTR